MRTQSTVLWAVVFAVSTLACGVSTPSAADGVAVVSDDPSSDENSSAVTSCPPGWVCPATPIYTSRVGAWFEPWWAGDPAPSGTISWPAVSQYQPLMNGTGRYYNCANRSDVAYELRAVKAAGIDYLILDDTNPFLNADNTLAKAWIQTNIATMFDVDSRLPAAEQVPMAVAIGGQLMINKSVELQNREANYIATNFFAWTPQYFKWDGLPLLVNYNMYSMGSATFAPAWVDATWRSTTRNAADLTNKGEQYFGGTPIAAHGWWGWTMEYPQPLNAEAMTVSPGADNIHRNLTGGCSGCNAHIDRQNGLLYVLAWLRAIKQNPRTIVISSWNEFGDDTAVESAWPNTATAPLWPDAYGQHTPDFYVQLTTGYTKLRTGLMPGGYYRDESSYDIYQVVNGRLVLQSQPPHGRAVVVVPAGVLVAMLRRQGS